MRLVLTTALSFFLFCAPALAANINAEGAAYLKSMFQNMLDKHAQKTVNDEKIVEYQGEVLVESADTYYAVTLPKTILHLINNEGEKGTLHIGMVTANLIPHDKPKQWKMSVATPTPILGYDENGTESLRLNIGKQTASGIWHEDFENFVQLNAVYQNITADIEGKPGLVSVENIKALYNLQESESERWSGPTNLTASNIRIAGAKQSGFFNIGEVAIKASADSFNQQTANEIETLIETLATQEEDTETFEPQSLIDLFMNIANGIAVDFSVSDIQMQMGENNEMNKILDMSLAPEQTTDFKSMKIDKIYAGLSLKGIMEDALNTKISFGFKGLEASPLPEGQSEGFFPSEVTFSINKKNIPIKQIATMFENAGSDPNAFNPMILMIKLPALLSNAATRVETQNTIGNEEWSIINDGHVQADLNAANSATALLISRFTNIDTVLGHAKAALENPTNEQGKSYQDLIKSLETLKDVGIVQTDAAGNTVHTFNLVMDETGNILLNDQPAMPILMQLKFPAGLF